MSKAEKMFSELGFEKDRYNSDGEYIVYESKMQTIRFWGITKRYEIRDFDKENSAVISTKLHKAITQQMKELGWLE